MRDYTICDYIDVTFKEFFDKGIENPVLIMELLELTKPSEREQLQIILETARQFRRIK